MGDPPPIGDMCVCVCVCVFKKKLNIKCVSCMCGINNGDVYDIEYKC